MLKGIPRSVWIALVIGLSARLVLAATTYGTNDVYWWIKFMHLVQSLGSVEIYGHIQIYNHPPLMSAYLWLLSHLPSVSLEHPGAFPFWFRLPGILADVGLVFVVYRLFGAYCNDRTPAAAAILVALSPVLILVSGFHGNTDTIFPFLILLAAERLLLGKQEFIAGLIFGLAANFKIVPILAIPTFFFWLRNWKSKTIFFSGFLMIVIFGYGYHVLNAYEMMVRNVFMYSALEGMWGFGAITSWLNLWGPATGTILKLLVFTSITAQAEILGARAKSTLDKQKRGRLLLESLGWTVLLFFIFTPGWGIQYFAWFAGPILFLSYRLAVRYHLVAGLLIFSAYNNWSNGGWWFAASVGWNPWEFFLIMLIWGYLVYWAYKNVGRLFSTVEIK